MSFAERTELLVSGQFDRFPLANISEPYTAAGEYHVVPATRYHGHWLEATVWHSWPPNGGNWCIAEDSGARVLEQCIQAEEVPAMLVTGQPHWHDYTLRTELRLLGASGPSALRRCSGQAGSGSPGGHPERSRGAARRAWSWATAMPGTTWRCC